MPKGARNHHDILTPPISQPPQTKYLRHAALVLWGVPRKEG